MKRTTLVFKSVWVFTVFISSHAWAGARGSVKGPQNLINYYTVKNDPTNFLNPHNGYVVNDVLGLIKGFVADAFPSSYFSVQDDVLKDSVIDPRGVIWGGVIKEGNCIHSMKHREAYDYCLNLNSSETQLRVRQALQEMDAHEGMKVALRVYQPYDRDSAEAVIRKYQEIFNRHRDKLIGAYFLPSAAHFLQLSIDNGYDFTSPSNPYRSHLKTLPDLNWNSFWSSSVHPDNDGYAYDFYGSSGELGTYDREYLLYGRCIRPLSAWE